MVEKRMEIPFFQNLKGSPPAAGRCRVFGRTGHADLRAPLFAKAGGPCRIVPQRTTGIAASWLLHDKLLLTRNRRGAAVSISA
jgi:hypothetical protein